jgi:hypothetical protein
MHIHETRSLYDSMVLDKIIRLVNKSTTHQALLFQWHYELSGSQIATHIRLHAGAVLFSAREPAEGSRSVENISIFSCSERFSKYQLCHASALEMSSIKI